jgi:glutamate N-acetyltransferase/amino-acid N-acetyltransferase
MEQKGSKASESAGWHMAQGFRFAGIHCGIRPDPHRLDLALLVSDTPAAAAGVFTQNRVAAAPVQLCRERLPAEGVRGVVICSGNANACTGAQGLADARRMTAVAAAELACREEQFLVASTGIIGRLLPMSQIEEGIPRAVRALDATPAALERAAHAILTTDTRIKVSTRSVARDGRALSVTGLAKGAAMIGPNLATMLAFVLTDAPATAENLGRLARSAAAQSFNCISVEGHTSTNDTLLVLANGAGTPLQGTTRDAFDRAVTDACVDLARAIAADAEGAQHLVTIRVEGLRSDAEARSVAKAVADSALVKTAIFGADPNWGRIVSAAGYAGVPFEEHDLSLTLGPHALYVAGVPQTFDTAAASAYLKTHRDIAIELRFTLGSGKCTFWTCDLGYEYIRLNAEYTT